MSLKVSDGELCASACPSVDKAQVWVLSETHSVFPRVCVRVCVFLGLPLHPSPQLYLCEVHSQRLLPEPVISSWVSAVKERTERVFALGCCRACRAHVNPGV